MTALFIDHITLLVHDVIIFQQALTDAEVVLFDFLLCPFDALGHHAVLDHFPFLITHFIHQRSNTVTAEHTHQVIFQANIELSGTGISLTGRTATQLPVHPAAFMSFRTDDRQPARFFHARSQLDIRTTTGHIRSDGHRSGQTGFRHYLRFPCMLFGIQYVVRDLFRLQHFAEELAHFHIRSTYQRGPAFRPSFLSLIVNRPIFFTFCLFDLVLVTLSVTLHHHHHLPIYH